MISLDNLQIFMKQAVAQKHLVSDMVLKMFLNIFILQRASDFYCQGIAQYVFSPYLFQVKLMQIILWDET
ncbi:MAG: hypothetical protein C4538_07250 [Nitrospiraceae bacterium]|nr:MAG: hypothetical protein C4538_07250 [Nitrospiraceae bacterium]